MDPQVHTLRTAVNFQIQQHPWATPNISSEMDGRVSEEGSLRMKSPGAALRRGGKRHRTSEEKESDGSDSGGGDEEVKKARPQRRCAWPDEPRLPEDEFQEFQEECRKQYPDTCFAFIVSDCKEASCTRSHDIPPAFESAEISLAHSPAQNLPTIAARGAATKGHHVLEPGRGASWALNATESAPFGQQAQEPSSAASDGGARIEGAAGRVRRMLVVSAGGPKAGDLRHAVAMFGVDAETVDLLEGGWRHDVLSPSVFGTMLQRVREQAHKQGSVDSAAILVVFSAAPPRGVQASTHEECAGGRAGARRD
ncbi:MAG: hypothetical protein SGPRY_003429 [Prymnesium sp.]